MVDDDRVKAITEYPIPRNIKEVRRFLGMSGWYRRFVENYATVAFPFTELLSSKRVFKWNPSSLEAFKELERRLTTAPCLIHPDYAKRFIVQCDASKVDVGAVLAQEDENGIERPIAFMSQKLNKAQRNYSVTELECLAVVLAINKFRIYIEGHEFSVITDHSSLRWLMNQKDLNGRLARWALKLQGLNFSIVHRKGKDNIVPDALSRSFMDEEVLELEKLPAIDLESSAFESIGYRALRERLSTDPVPDYTVVEKYIYYRINFDEYSQWKLLVPEEIRKDVIYSHNTPSSAHGGIAKTLYRVRRHFYWPGMVADVKKYILSCESCQTSKTPNQTLRPTMGNMTESERPFQKLFIDLIGPFPRSKQGNIGVCIILDHFSKFTFLKPLRKFCSKQIIKFLREDIFHCFGVPETIISDNGSQFKCKDFNKFLDNFGVKNIYTALYSPQANASERVNRSINEALRAFIQNDQRDWDKFLSSINSSLRSSIHQSIGKSPYYVVFGQNMIGHADDYKLLRNLNMMTDGPLDLKREEKFQWLRDDILNRMRTAYDHNARSYNLRSRNRRFELDQIVTRRNFCQSNLLKHFNAKLAPVGIKSRVLERIGNCNYRLQDVNGGSTGIFHAKDIW